MKQSPPATIASRSFDGTGMERAAARWLSRMRCSAVARGGCYLPCQTGCRLPTKASIPSPASSLIMLQAMTSPAY